MTAEKYFKYNALQTTAFKISDSSGWNRTFQLLRFPERWKPSLLDLVRKEDQRDSIPVRSLNRVLTALIPDVITVATSAARGFEPPWIYADSAIPLTAVFPIITAWVRTLRPDRVQLTERALTVMSVGDLAWEEIEVDFAAAIRKTLSNEETGTDVLTDSVFRLLPHEIAAHLSRDGLECIHGEGGDDNPVHGTSVFRRSPTTQRAEIMSWPPHSNPTKPFSFTVALSVQTRPFSEEPVLHAHIGARRWVQRKPQLDAKVASTVFFLPSVRWIPGVELSRSFHRAAIKITSTRGADGKPVFTAAWDDVTVKILGELGAGGHLGLPEEIRKNPKAYLDHATEPAGLVFRNGLYSIPGKPAGKHPVLPGASVKDRRRIVQWLAESTDGALQLSEPLPRNRAIAIPEYRIQDAAEGTPDRTAERLRKSIAWATQKPALAIEIYYDTTRNLDDALATLQAQLNVKFELPEAPQDNGRFEATARTPELELRLRVQPVGDRAADLVTKPIYKKPIERLQRAVEARAADVAATLSDPDPDCVTVALVEIGGKESYQGKRREKDPKFAIRHGFTLKNRLTQFITPFEEKDAEDEPSTAESEDGDRPARKKSEPNVEKMHSSWRDLWRQLGARANPIPPLTEDMPTRPRYLAFYVIRQNRTRVWGATRQVPIAVLMNADGSGIQVKGPDMDAFLPLHSGVLELGRRHIMANQRRNPEEIAGFCKDILAELDPQGGLLLLTEAHNLRSAWTFLQNPAITVDSLRFGEKGELQSIYDYPGLRHVRVRTDSRNETPEGYAVVNDDAGHAPGIWALSGDRVFISTADKPVTASSAVKDRSKVEPRDRRKKDGTLEQEPVKLRALVWNHQLVELAVAGKQEGDLPDVWAALAHDLRWAAPHTSKTTILPWPLHLAKLIGEYVLPIELIADVEAEDDIEPPMPTGARSFDEAWEQVELEFEE